MAYGRLDVFWPDGQFNTFPLIENRVSVGRSTGNTIALETNTISRYHFSITHDGNQVYITDLESANGTFVDSVRLAPNTPLELDGGEDIQVGDLRIIFHQLDEQPTQPMKALDDLTQRIEMTATAFRLDVLAPVAPFSPGAHQSAEISITNTGNIPQQYRIEASGMPEEWIRIHPPDLTIDPGESAQALVSFRPLRRPESRPGDYSVVVRVSPKDQPEAHLEARMVVHVLPYSGFGLALERTALQRGERFRLHVHNQGSAPLPLTIGAFDRHNHLRFTLPTPKLTLAPGARYVVQGEVRPARTRLFGQPLTHPFDLQVRALDASRFLAVTRGYLVEKAAMPGWAPLALTGAGVIGVLLLALIVSVLFATPRPPQITRFEVSSTRVARGEPVTLNWAANDVTELRLSINGSVLDEPYQPQTTGLTLDTSELSGEVVIALIGINDGQQTSASQTVSVFEPQPEGFFIVNPPQLVRNLVQSLSLSWNVPEAVTTRLSGLEGFTTTQLNPSYGPQASLPGVAGIAKSSLTLSLYMTNSAGDEAIYKTLEVPVIDPTCIPVDKAVTLYFGPDFRHQVVGTIPAGAQVVVDAQDVTGVWIRAQLPGGLTGWGARDLFKCGFNPAELFKEPNVPPTPTTAPTNIPVTPTRTLSTPQPATSGPTPTAAG